MTSVVPNQCLLALRSRLQPTSHACGSAEADKKREKDERLSARLKSCPDTRHIRCGVFSGSVWNLQRWKSRTSVRLNRRQCMAALAVETGLEPGSIIVLSARVNSCPVTTHV